MGFGRRGANVVELHSNISDLLLSQPLILSACVFTNRMPFDACKFYPIKDGSGPVDGGGGGVSRTLVVTDAEVTFLGWYRGDPRLRFFTCLWLALEEGGNCTSVDIVGLGGE